jgi:hypothetical protein
MPTWPASRCERVLWSVACFATCCLLCCILVTLVSHIGFTLRLLLRGIPSEQEWEVVVDLVTVIVVVAIVALLMVLLITTRQV